MSASSTPTIHVPVSVASKVAPTAPSYWDDEQIANLQKNGWPEEFDSLHVIWVIHKAIPHKSGWMIGRPTVKDIGEPLRHIEVVLKVKQAVKRVDLGYVQAECFDAYQSKCPKGEKLVERTVRRIASLECTHSVSADVVNQNDRIHIRLGQCKEGALQDGQCKISMRDVQLIQLSPKQKQRNFSVQEDFVFFNDSKKTARDIDCSWPSESVETTNK